MAYAAVLNGVGVIVEVNAESDFVAKNELFVDYVKGVADVVAKENPADLDALMACKYLDTGKTVQEVQNEKVLVISENIHVRRFARIDTGLCVPYVHMGGKIAVLVNLETTSADEKVVELGKDVAMQIAAMTDAPEVGYLAYDADKLEKLFEHPAYIKTPIVRNGKQATVGYCPDVWKTWE